MNYAIVFLRVVFSVTNKMTAGAKSFGSFFTGVVNKAGAKIKETVKDNVSIKATNCLRLVALISVDLQSILGEFNKEQEAFIKDQSGKGGDAGICPWVGHGLNEDKIKEEILSLSGVSGPRKFGSSKIHDTIFSVSQDRRNFVRAPPAGIDFEFNYDASYPTALALMAEDSQLEKMRFDLVPKM